MKVMLSEDVVGLGDIGEVVTVRPGYARNFLLPRGIAMEWGSASSKELEHRVKQIESKKRRMKKEFEVVAQKIRELAVSFEVRVATGGKVFGSVGTKEIALKLNEAGFALDRKRVLLPEPLKKVGTHFVKIKLHPEVEALLKVVVNQLEATEAEEATETRQARKALDEKSAERDSEEILQ